MLLFFFFFPGVFFVRRRPMPFTVLASAPIHVRDGVSSASEWSTKCHLKMLFSEGRATMCGMLLRWIRAYLTTRGAACNSRLENGYYEKNTILPFLLSIFKFAIWIIATTTFRIKKTSEEKMMREFNCERMSHSVAEICVTNTLTNLRRRDCLTCCPFRKPMSAFICKLKQLS